jgi:uncharacterized protein YprB with RNaseH-like and TPR domain
MRTIIFDCETGGLPEAQILSIIKPFDPATVKHGNIKSVELIANKIEESRASYYADAIERAALSALTGRVLAIGLKEVGGEIRILDSADERALISEFWTIYSNEPAKFVGFNSLRFDIPFLMRRSWALGMKLPYLRKGRYWVDALVDMRELWQAGDKQAEGSLEVIGKSFGLGGKAGDGADFAKLWTTDRPKAIAYLTRDLELTEAVYLRMTAA